MPCSCCCCCPCVGYGRCDVDVGRCCRCGGAYIGTDGVADIVLTCRFGLHTIGVGVVMRHCCIVVVNPVVGVGGDVVCGVV